uniref:Uncharacterized protein n=1 Tax=Romanomermis culicivorax TaxID=13658 RepID=A0A915KL41_ROMCU
MGFLTAGTSMDTVTLHKKNYSGCKQTYFRDMVMDGFFDHEEFNGRGTWCLKVRFYSNFILAIHFLIIERFIQSTMREWYFKEVAIKELEVASEVEVDTAPSPFPVAPAYL